MQIFIRKISLWKRC